MQVAVELRPCRAGFQCATFRQTCMRATTAAPTAACMHVACNNRTVHKIAPLPKIIHACARSSICGQANSPRGTSGLKATGYHCALQSKSSAAALKVRCCAAPVGTGFCFSLISGSDLSCVTGAEVFTALVVSPRRRQPEELLLLGV